MKNKQTQFKNFLQGGLNEYINTNIWGTEKYLKMESGIKDIEMVFCGRVSENGILDLFSENLKFVGFYHKSKEAFYEIDRYSLCFDLFGEYIDITEFKLNTVYCLMNELGDEANKLLNKKIYNNELPKDIELDEKTIQDVKERAPYVAFDRFMNFSEVNNNGFSVKGELPNVKYSGDLLFLYLDNPQKVIEKIVDNYIQNNVKHIREMLFLDELVEKEIAKLEKNDELLERRHILSILNDKSRKTLNIELLKDNENHQFKVEVGSFNREYDYFDKYSVIGNDNQEYLDKLYNDQENYFTRVPLKDIVKITYSRKVLYERQAV